MRRWAAPLVLVSLALASAPAAALPTPGLFCDTAPPTGERVFPEAGETNDFVSLDEAVCGLAALDEAYPDRIEVRELGESFGWRNAVTGQQDRFPVLAVEVTNEASAHSRDAKPKILFQLSIHGNEKGGREGGLRVIEDLVRGDLGLAEKRPDLVAMLDDVLLVFLFPNPDGWTHEETQYRQNCPSYFAVPVATTCIESQNFVRTNGNGVDLNRDLPTRGWYDERYTAVSEPEVSATLDYLSSLTDLRLASDIHGMLQPANAQLPFSAFDPTNPQLAHLAPPDKGNFVLTMLPAGRQDPRELAITTLLAEDIKERLNADPYFAEWRALPRGFGVWGGEFNDWGTVWDTLGYTDSGFSSDYFAQDHGLDAPGVDFELSYNHVTFDNYYPGLAQRMNMYHVQSVRVIVEAFMDRLAMDLEVAVDAAGRDTAVLANPVRATSADDATPLSGWAAENPLDDAWDHANVPFEASPQEYWTDLAPYVRAGRLDVVGPADLTGGLAEHENLVVAGAAWRTISSDAAAKAAARAFAERGGTLVLTDEAVAFLEELGLADSTGVTKLYAAYSDLVDREHGLVADVRGLARQLVEPVPLGYPIRDVDAGGPAAEIPVHWATGDALAAVGVLGPDEVVVGEAKLGAGRVVILGAFLPDPNEDLPHPYGLDAYATTYTANQIMLNALGWTRTTEESPFVVDPAPAPADAQGVPGVAWLGAVVAVGIATALVRRRTGNL